MEENIWMTREMKDTWEKRRGTLTSLTRKEEEGNKGEEGGNVINTQGRRQ